MTTRIVLWVFLFGVVLRPALAGPRSGGSFGGRAGFSSSFRSAPTSSFRAPAPKASPSFTYRPSVTTTTWRPTPSVRWTPAPRYVTSTTHVFYVSTPVFHHGHYYDHYYQDDGEIYFEDQVRPSSGGGCWSAPTPIKHVIDGGVDLPAIDTGHNISEGG